MLIYVFTFLFSAFLLYCSDYIENKYLKKCTICLALLVPALLAGVRSSSIGTDVETYAISYFNEAHASSSFAEFFTIHNSSLLSEPLYYLSTYALARVFDDYHWALFMYQLITVCFGYFGMKRCKKIFNTPIYLGMLIYYLMLYNYSLNIIRQCIAVSIVFYAITLLFEKKYKRYFVFTLIAIGFHTSAIIALVFLPMYLLLHQEEKITLRKQMTRGAIFLIILAIVISLGSTIIQQLVDMGILRAWYTEYLSTGKYATDVSYISIISFIPQLLYLIVLLLHYKITFVKGQESMFFLMNAIVVLLMPFLYLVSRFSSRLGYYFWLPLTVSLVNVTLCYEKKSRLFVRILLLLFIGAIWYREIVVLGYNETVPYAFFWQ